MRTLAKRCPICEGRLKSLYYFVNTKQEKKWHKAGYICLKCGKVFSLDEVNGKKEE